MIERGKNLKMNFPIWLVISFSFCGVFTILFFAFYIIWVLYNGQLASRLFNCSVGFVVILGAIWVFLKVIFYSVTVTDEGLKTSNIIGKSKLFRWDEIVDLRRPRFGIPGDFNYVISRNNDSLLLVRSMQNYKELIDLIKVRSPNLGK